MSATDPYGRLDTEARHLGEDVREIKSRLTSLEGTTHDIKVHMAELIGKFATVDAVLRLQTDMEHLKSELARGRGMAQMGWMLIGLVFTLANLAIASKGKIW